MTDYDIILRHKMGRGDFVTDCDVMLRHIFSFCAFYDTPPHPPSVELWPKGFACIASGLQQRRPF